MPREAMDEAAAARIRKAKGEDVCAGYLPSTSTMLTWYQDPFAQRATNAARQNQKADAKDASASKDSTGDSSGSGGSENNGGKK